MRLSLVGIACGPVSRAFRGAIKKSMFPRIHINLLYLMMLGRILITAEAEAFSDMFTKEEGVLFFFCIFGSSCSKRSLIKADENSHTLT